MRKGVWGVLAVTLPETSQGEARGARPSQGSAWVTSEQGARRPHFPGAPSPGLGAATGRLGLKHRFVCFTTQRRG